MLQESNTNNAELIHNDRLLGLWQYFLCLIICKGTLDAYMAVLSRQHNIIWWIPIAVWTVVILTIFIIKYISVRIKSAYLFSILAGAILFAVFNPVNMVRAFLQMCNDVILKYNDAENVSLRLFSVVEPDDRMITCFVTAVFLIAFGVYNYLVTKHPVLLLLVVTASFLVPLRTDMLSRYTMVFVFAAEVGLLLTYVNKRVTLNVVTGNLLVLMACVAAVSFIKDGSELTQVTEFRQSVKEAVYHIRYGGDTLPKGNVYELQTMLENDEGVLEVRASGNEDMYLRGYVAGRFFEGKWKELTEREYTGEYSGMLGWLEKRGFTPQSQYALYKSLSGKTIRSRVELVNLDADRKYEYAPYNICAEDTGHSRLNYDNQLTSNKFRGTYGNTFEKENNPLPGEMVRAEQWLYNPETDGQREYAESEKVYRKFVYDNYLDVPKSAYEQMKGQFSDEEITNHSVYSVTSIIRKKLEGLLTYEEEPEAVPEEVNPVRYWLNTDNRTNAVGYTTLGVLAYRMYGIPARYAEGYYISRERLDDAKGKKITVTGKDAHAWVEVYMDGVGWLPVDVTSGFYYDEYILKNMAGSTTGSDMEVSVGDDGKKLGESVTEDIEKAGRPGKHSSHVDYIRILVIAGVAVICTACLLLVLAELRYWLLYLGYSIKFKRASDREKIMMNKRMIENMFRLLGIEMCVGWQSERTDEQLNEKVPYFTRGEYMRVSSILEKAMYCEEGLGEYEKNVLLVFYNKIYEARKTMPLKERIKLRYGRQNY